MLAEKQVKLLNTFFKKVTLNLIQVSAFATWEQEKNKISHDPRFALLTAKERKQEFDRYTHGESYL